MEWVRKGLEGESDEFKEIYEKVKNLSHDSEEVIIEKSVIDLKGYTWGIWIEGLTEDYETAFVWDDFWKEFGLTTVYPITDDEWGRDDFFWMDSKKPISGFLPSYKDEELAAYGNRLQLILPVNDSVYSLSAVFLDNIFFLDVYPDSFPEDDWRDVVKWLKKNINSVIDVAASYGWKSVDAWRGFYDSEKESGAWEKIVQGWVGIGSSDENVEKLAKVSKLEITFDFPVILVFPRGSNVCVTYFDVWVPKGKGKVFVYILGLEDKFSFSDGVDVEVLDGE